MTSIFLPATAGPNYSTAMLTASTEPGPALSRPQLLRSVSTPMRTTSSDTWAIAAGAESNSSAPTTTLIIMSFLPVLMAFPRRYPVVRDEVAPHFDCRRPQRVQQEDQPPSSAQHRRS